MQNSRYLRCGRMLVAVFALLIGSVQIAHAQGQFGSILERDRPFGRCYPRRQSSGGQRRTNLRLETTSNQFGIYQLLQLNPGTYSIEAEAAGFKKVERSAVRVRWPTASPWTSRWRWAPSRKRSK